MSDHQHTFSSNPLDRGEALRRDATDIESLTAHPAARVLAFFELNVATTADDQLDWQPMAALADDREPLFFLGIDEHGPCFATQHAAPRSNYSDCRLLAAALPTPQTGILAQARALVHWHHNNPYCARCGGATQAERGGHIRRCGACGHHIFPRTDPVVIMLVIGGPSADACLLGQPRGRMANTNFYSALAGFVDQGESIEDAVRREVGEEAGIDVGVVRYHSSQPVAVSVAAHDRLPRTRNVERDTYGYRRDERRALGHARRSPARTGGAGQ